MLYSFCSQAKCADGSPPSGPLNEDSEGNLYGTTYQGGGTGCFGGGCGTIFKMAPDGTEKTLYQFCSKANCADGAYPTGGLFADKRGNLYGTTFIGGACAGRNECVGTVFKLSPDGTETVIYSFCSKPAALNYPCKDGFNPNGGVIMDRNGNLYGTTEQGGSAEFPSGTVFKIAPDGRESLLYSFNGNDGANPEAGLIADKAGNLYGTASGGNGFYCHTSGCGTVFKVAPDGTEIVLHTFCTSDYCPDGYEPVGNLIIDGHGNLYGVTTLGGNQGCYRGLGCGTIFEVSPDGNESVIHSFCSAVGCKDGYYPYAGLVADSGHNFYGTTSYGSGTACGSTGCGAVVKFAPDGELTVLTSFKGPPSAAFPQTSLIADKTGQLFGTTNAGGAGTQCGYVYGCGTVFVLTQ